MKIYDKFLDMCQAVVDRAYVKPAAFAEISANLTVLSTFYNAFLMDSFARYILVVCGILEWLYFRDILRIMRLLGTFKGVKRIYAVGLWMLLLSCILISAALFAQSLKISVSAFSQCMATLFIAFTQCETPTKPPERKTHGTTLDCNAV